VTGGAVTIANNATFGAAVRLVTNSGGATNGANVTGTLSISGVQSLWRQHHPGRRHGAQANAAIVHSQRGILDMGNTTVGASGNAVTFNAQSGTLKTLNELNGGATLTRRRRHVDHRGNNSYTGLTDVTAGKVSSAARSREMRSGGQHHPGQRNNTSSTIGGNVTLLSTGAGGGTLAPGDTATPSTRRRSGC